MSADHESWPCVALGQLSAYVVRCVTSVGTKVEHAEALAELLVIADYRGHYSHGLNRLDMYVADIRNEITVYDKEPVVLEEKAATAWVDGNNVLGPVVGKFCIDLAIAKAKEAGIGMVVAKGSNHFGIAGWYSMRASEQGMLGMALTNSSPIMVPTRAKKATLGSNPISVAAPASGSDSFVLDMATSTVALGKVEINQRKGLPIPNGWGCDEHGKETNDPEDVLEGGGLLALGGMEVSGGYKGYGLAMMVEVLCGILAGSRYGPNIRHWKGTTGVADLGQCFIAIDPSSFAPGFPERMSDLMGSCRNLEPAEGCSSVLVPGDPEREHMAVCDRRGGIPYHPNQIKHLMDLAKELGVDPPTIIY